MKKRWGWLALLAVVAAAVGGVLYWRSRSGTEETTVMSTVVTATRGDLTASISPTGQVYTAHTATLGFEVTKIELIELHVAAGQEVKQGEVLARIDPSPLERAVAQAEADLADAQEALQAVESPNSELDRLAAELAVTQAQTALELAKEALAELQDPDLPAAERAVRQAAFGLESAKMGLTLARYSTTVGKAVRDAQYAVSWHERKLRDLVAQQGQGSAGQGTVGAGSVGISQGPGPAAGQEETKTLEEQIEEEEAALADARVQLAAAQKAAGTALDNAQYKVTRAEQDLADARERLADLKAGPTPLEISQAQNAVAAAEYDLAKAQQDQADLNAGPDTGQVQLAQSRVAAAQATLEEAQATLDAATLVAPFDGTVVSVGAEVGDEVSAGTPVIVIADLTELRVMASIDETEISQVEIGQDVTITFDAFAGYTFQGKVLEVPLQGTVSQSIVTYQVPISLEGIEGVDVKSGMTANLTIVTGQVENALLIPALAVQQGDSGNVVMVDDGTGSAVETPVEVGVSNGTYTQVMRGLNEGDQVVVVYDTSEDTGFGFFQGGTGILGGGILGGSQEIRVRP